MNKGVCGMFKNFTNHYLITHKTKLLYPLKNYYKLL